MKKILFCINALRGGGAERVLVDMANELSKRDFDVTVLAIIGCGTFENRLSDSVRYKSIVNIKCGFLRKVLIYLLSFVLPPSVVHRLFVGNGYDYEIAFLEGVPTKIIGASLNKQSKKYAWVHIDLYNTFGLEKVHRNLDEHRKTYGKFDEIVCVSETVKNAFFKRFGLYDNVRVCYNVIDEDIIRQKANEAVLKKDRFWIVTVGRLAKQKGFDRMIEVMRKLKKDGVSAKLSIVGEGEERTALEELIANYRLSEIVELVGFDENPYKYIGSADLLVFPSRAEGYSTVVSETLVLGKPIVVSRCSGMDELLGDSEWGIITDSDDELYSAVKLMITDSSVRRDYEKRAQERAKAYSKETQLNEIMKLFE